MFVHRVLLINPILHGLFDRRILQGGGGRNAPYVLNKVQHFKACPIYWLYLSLFTINERIQQISHPSFD